MLNADKEENPQKETPLHQGFLKATCKGKILMTACIHAWVEFTPAPATPRLPSEVRSRLNADHNQF